MKTFTMIVTASLLSLSLQGCVILSNPEHNADPMSLEGTVPLPTEPTNNLNMASTELMVDFLRYVFVPVLTVLMSEG